MLVSIRDLFRNRKLLLVLRIFKKKTRAHSALYISPWWLQSTSFKSVVPRKRKEDKRLCWNRSTKEKKCGIRTDRCWKEGIGTHRSGEGSEGYRTDLASLVRSLIRYPWDPFSISRLSPRLFSVKIHVLGFSYLACKVSDPLNYPT